MNHKMHRAWLTLPTLWLLMVGCTANHTTESFWNPFGLVPLYGTSGEPIRVAITDSSTGVFDTASWAFISHRPPWEPLSRTLSKQLKRPVYGSQLKHFQIAHHLQTGLCQFALASQETMAYLRQHNVDVIPIAQARIWRRQGVIVASRRSTIRSLEDIKGKRFAFGPRQDPVLHMGTLATLAQAGILPSDIKQEFAITGFDGTLQHHRNSRDAARTIVYGFGNFLEFLGTSVGVLETSVYDAFPDTGGTWTPLFFTFSKDQFVELARTEAMEAETLKDALFVASTKTDPAMVRKVKKSLLSMAKSDPQALHAIGFSRFDSAGQSTLAAISNEPASDPAEPLPRTSK